MHISSHETMKKFLSDFDVNQKLKVLDVGSLALNSTLTYRTLMSENWQYIGLDIVGGPNVDVVTENVYKYPFVNCYFDIIISGQCMEHVPQIWTWMDELYRLLKPGGSICIIAPSAGKEHTNADFWRIMPQGMSYIMEWAGLKVKEVFLVGNPKWNDCVGIAERIQ